MQFAYPASLSRAAPDETVVSFRDLPECLTSGTNAQEALSAAADALEEALAGRIDDGDVIPRPSVAESGECNISVPPGKAAKAALTIAFPESGLTRVGFAAYLGVDEKVVRRILDPRHGASPDRIEKALRLLGRRLAVEVHAA